MENLNFELQKGEKLGILGRNGAGKSTLIRLISGAEFPTSGRVITDMSVSWPLAFGGAFQENLTGIDNVRFISRIYDQDFEKNLAFVEDFSELGQYLREEVRTYSSGMRARLAFAISMITEFDCFLIDEVSAVGDARFHARCNYELFERRADRAMIIVSHNVSYISNNCNKFALLHDAQLKIYDDFEEAYSEFRSKIGIADKQVLAAHKPELAATSRKQIIEVTNSTALHDEKFLNLVLEADISMQAKRWEEARKVFEKAFEIFPYNGVYWNQWAHAVKEAGDYELAEIGYRTSCALGQSVGETEEFMTFVLKQLDRFPADKPLKGLNSGPTHAQPLSIPDVAIFGRAAWGVKELERRDLMHLMREYEDLDGCLAGMIKDDRFAQMHQQWLKSSDDPKALGKQIISSGKATRSPEPWVSSLVTIAEVEKREKGIRRVARMIETMSDALPVLIASGGFAKWPKTQAALQERFA
ncbi:ATP-binding cassette domain-containing protein [Erythrobacter sp. SCSIO 43205]|uniref:ATP-binding cassette domain-containing protein n=1 Tax=Erythrobacter sp. SCSIO 43205 TaxID=2779361 RepID=UPI00351D6988